MSTGPTVVVAPESELEDLLAYLPRRKGIEYEKNQVVYHSDQLSTDIYLVVNGKVKVSRMRDTGQQVVVDIYQRDELFGESAFLDLPRSEQARALEKTTLMNWTVAEIEEIVMQRPRLGIAMLQVLARRAIDFGHRIESLSMETTARRLARSLIRLSERLGTPHDDGSVRMIPFTHELLSEYVGTSREVVTVHMNQFRRQGYLQYSRKGIMLHAHAFSDWFRPTD